MRSLAMLTLLILAFGCTSPTSERPCVQKVAMGGLRKFEVANVGQWCGFAVGYWNVADAPSIRITAEPKHGKARVRTTTQSVRVEYLPAPGYTGPDEFEFSMMENYTAKAVYDVLPSPLRVIP